MGIFSVQKLLHKTKNEITEVLNAEDELKDMEVVLVYFSAHWCPPCRAFTPVLKAFYEELEKKNEKIAIVFVSCDQDEAAMKSYMQESHGDWYAVPFGSYLSSKLQMNCSVSGIPKLCIVNMEGECIYGEARSDIQGPPDKAFQKFQQLAKAKK